MCLVAYWRLVSQAHALLLGMVEHHSLYVSRRDAMKRILRLESSEHIHLPNSQRNTKINLSNDGFRLKLSKAGKGSSGGVTQCAECGGDVRIFVSPRRNPHSSKLGRAVSMKDHDLCRRCWRRVMHQQRNEGVTVLPLSMFIGGRKLRPRLLIPKPISLPKEAS